MIANPISDNELIYRIKEQNDSAALAELTDRHSGIYVKIASRFSGFSDKIQLAELKDDKQYNMYKWIIDYKPDRNMKLSTYIGERTKYLCLDILSETPDKVPLDSVSEPAANPVAPPSTVVEEVKTIEKTVGHIPNDKFWPIFRARHGEQTKTWRDIGREVGVTHEWARQIYNRYLPRVKEKAIL